MTSPEERLAEAVKQATTAAESDLADAHTRRLIENATSSLEIAARRVRHERFDRDGQEVKVIEYEQWVAAGSPGDFEKEAHDE
jgi:hypothetical protein